MTTRGTETLVTALGPNAESPDVSAQCQSIMKIFALSLDEFRDKWDSFALNFATDASQNIELNMTNLREFQSHVQSELDKRTQRKVIKNVMPGATPMSSVKKKMSSPGQFFDFMATPASKKRKPVNNNVNSTPSRVKLEDSPSLGEFKTPAHPARPLLSSSPSITMSPYKQRKDPGKTISTLNPHLFNDNSERLASKDRVKLTVNINPKKFSYRTMYTKLSDVAETLDEQIESCIRIVQEAYSVDDDTIGNPAISSQSEIVAVGRVVSDSSGDAKLADRSIMIESCRRLGAGMRARLNLEKLTSFFLFPGQVIACKGMNPDGSEFIVSEILDLPLLPAPGTLADEMNSILDRQDNKPMSVIAAAGPFTASDNLLFEPLDDLIEQINTNSPDVVVLMGPFLDYAHPLVENGDFEVTDPQNPNVVLENATLDDLFRSTVATKLKKITDPNINVILIPNVRDTISNHSSFPQPQIDRKMLDLPRNFKCMTNPSTFSLNEVVFAVASVDPIQDIIRYSARKIDAVPQGKSATSSYTLALQQLLMQRTLYPVIPGSNSTTSTVNLDIPYTGLAEFSRAVPDIIILPCLLNPVAEVVHNVVTISPGLLAKRSSGGTYATITIAAPTAEMIEENTNQTGVVSHKIWDRTRVDVTKI